MADKTNENGVFVRFPKEILDWLDELIGNDEARNRQSVIVDAVYKYKNAYPKMQDAYLQPVTETN